MSWIKDGRWVRAEYCGTTFDGVVLSSRVKYGGMVQYRVEALEPFYVACLDSTRDVVLIDADEIIMEWDEEVV